MNCRSGCTTPGAHATWAECARSANLSVGARMGSPLRSTYDKTDRELSTYRQVRAEGIQPEGTTMEKINAAKMATENLGRPYNANVDPPARLIRTKNAGRFVAGGAA